MIRCMVGYRLADGVTAEDYDAWMWGGHTDDLLANPYLDKLVFNTVIQRVDTPVGETRPLSSNADLYRIAELHFRDMAAYDAYRAWFDTNPLRAERGPAGRADFQFYYLCRVDEFGR